MESFAIRKDYHHIDSIPSNSSSGEFQYGENFCYCDGVTEENSFAAKILHNGWLLPHSLQAGMKWVISAFHWVSPIDTNLSLLMMSTNRKQLSPKSSDEEECQLQIIIKEGNSRREPMLALLKPPC